MTVTLEQVRAVLMPEEPNYERAARLGTEALPHLKTLIREGDQMLASKAAYLAGLINDDDSADVLKEAARSEHPAVRVAAAAGARHLNVAASSEVISALLDDQDIGVRKVALKSIPPGAMAGLRQKVEALKKSDPEPKIRTLSGQVLEKMRP
jgi:HEAT repeat protein